MSVVGNLSKQWLETISDKLSNYGDFQQVFVNTWWSSSQQRLVKCSICQRKYDRRSNLTLSVYFLKCTKMALHLEPIPTVTEMIEAMRYHFPIQVQRAMLSTQLSSIRDAVDLPKRIELMESRGSFQKKKKPMNNMTAPYANDNRPLPPWTNYDRNRNQGQVCNVQRYKSQNYRPCRYDQGKDDNSGDEESQNFHSRSLCNSSDRGPRKESPRIEHRRHNRGK